MDKSAHIPLLQFDQMTANLRPISILAVADELFLTAHWYIGRKCFSSKSVQCEGFDGEKKESVADY